MNRTLFALAALVLLSFTAYAQVPNNLPKPTPGFEWANLGVYRFTVSGYCANDAGQQIACTTTGWISLNFIYTTGLLTSSGANYQRTFVLSGISRSGLAGLDAPSFFWLTGARTGMLRIEQPTNVFLQQSVSRLFSIKFSKDYKSAQITEINANSFLNGFGFLTPVGVE